MQGLGVKNFLPCSLLEGLSLFENKGMNKKIENSRIVTLSGAVEKNFPKYTTTFINQINQIAQATRSKVVGQMSDLIQQFDGSTLEDWKTWYDNKMPGAIDKAVKKICEKRKEMIDAWSLIDEKMIRDWVEDLVYTKTFCGLKVQQAILHSIAEDLKKTWRLATKEEESKGIDGFINEKPVQIKSSTYRSKNGLNEEIDVPIIYYEKKKGGIEIEYESSWFC